MLSRTAALVDQWCDFSVLCSAHRLYISCSLVITHGSVTGWPNWISTLGTWNVIALRFDQPSLRWNGELIPCTRPRDARTMPGRLLSSSKPCVCCDCAVSSLRKTVSFLTNSEPVLFQFSPHSCSYDFACPVEVLPMLTVPSFCPSVLYNVPAPNVHKYTWTSLEEKTDNQIDHMLVDRRWIRVYSMYDLSRELTVILVIIWWFREVRERLSLSKQVCCRKIEFKVANWVLM